MKQRYSEKEDSIIIQCMEQSPDNIKYAARVASTKIDRSSIAIIQRYYSKLRYKNNILGVGSSKGVIINTKNTPKPKGMTFSRKTKNEWIKVAFIQGKKEDIIDFFLNIVNDNTKDNILTKIVNRIDK